MENTNQEDTMSLIDLINTDQETASDEISTMLSAKVFDFLDNYSLDEAVVSGSVKKDKSGDVESFKTVPDSDDPAGVLKHVNNPDNHQKAFAKLVKPGSYKDRADFLHDAKHRAKNLIESEDLALEEEKIEEAMRQQPGQKKSFMDHLEDAAVSKITRKPREWIAKAKNFALKKLTEEDLEAMSQEEFDAIDEEQLDELSKKTLGSYIKKANDRRGVNSISDHELDVRSAGVMTAADKLTAKSSGNKDAPGFKKTFDKRVDKLTKEDLEAMSQEEFDAIDEEQLDELTKTTLKSYINAAALNTVIKAHTAGQASYAGNWNKAEENNTKAVKRLGKISVAANKLVK